MGANSSIEWTDHTFNPWVGCTKISPGCDHCYAEGWAKRTGGAALWQGERRRTSDANWRQPAIWNRKAAAAGTRARVFCASLADVFDNQAPDIWRSLLWQVIDATPHLDWLLLTKRPQNIVSRLPKDWGAGRPNVWLGTTTENRTEMLRRGQALAAVPARVRFWSAEPLLEPLGDIPAEIMPSWIIAGGESGPGARPAHPDWFRSLRDQCAAADVPFHFKQWGEWFPGDLESAGEGLMAMPDTDHDPRADQWEFPAARYSDGMLRVGKKRAGALLDGVEHRAVPA